MNKTYDEKLEYILHFLSKESIAKMLLSTIEGDKLVGIYIDIRATENAIELEKRAKGGKYES